MNYFLLVTLALLPSLIWLLFYLRKDAHPESNQMILKIFFWGMIAAIPAVFIELGFFQITGRLPLPYFLISLLNVFLGVALVEELLKYFVVRERVFSSSELDEPLDVMLYMIIAALGFVTFENILIFLSPQIFDLKIGETLALAIFRFISATFLHALASGALGFFLALSFFDVKKRFLYFMSGLFLASLLHGIYNFYIMTEGGYLRFLAPAIIIIGLAIFVSYGFKKLKNLKSVCNI